MVVASARTENVYFPKVDKNEASLLHNPLESLLMLRSGNINMCLTEIMDFEKNEKGFQVRQQAKLVVVKK